MKKLLDAKAVKDWISGQNAWTERRKVERALFLLSLTSERSLEYYLELYAFAEKNIPKTPSTLLLAMRVALFRMKEGKRE